MRRQHSDRHAETRGTDGERANDQRADDGGGDYRIGERNDCGDDRRRVRGERYAAGRFDHKWRNDDRHDRGERERNGRRGDAACRLRRDERLGDIWYDDGIRFRDNGCRWADARD